jgi:predicted RNA polymerase sigma factor
VRDSALDDELAMMFMYCHPSLPHAGRVALTLKTGGGFGIGELAAAFRAEPDAIAQRLVRAKRQIREQQIAIQIPRPDELGARLEVELNLAIALAMADGPAAGIAAIARIEADPALARYYLLPAALGGLWLEAGDEGRAAVYHREALTRSCSAPGRRFLEKQLARCGRQ